MFPTLRSVKKIQSDGDRNKITAKSAKDVVENARKVREERILAKELGSYARRLQSWWRGVFTRIRLTRSLRMDYDKKMEDIKKLVSILKISRSATVSVFIPPSKIVIELSRELTYGSTSDLKV